MLGVIGQVRIAGSGEDRVVAEDFLDLQQIDTGLDQVRGVAVAQAVRRDVFFTPHDAATLRKVVCTPPRSSGVVAVRAPASPPVRLGNSSTGLRWRDRKRVV